MTDQFAIKTKIKLINLKTYLNTGNLIAVIMQGKHVLIGGSEALEEITEFINKRYSIPFHLSEQKAFLANCGLFMRKSLPQIITYQINKM